MQIETVTIPNFLGYSDTARTVVFSQEDVEKFYGAVYGVKRTSNEVASKLEAMGASAFLEDERFADVHPECFVDGLANATGKTLDFCDPYDDNFPENLARHIGFGAQRMANITAALDNPDMRDIVKSYILGDDANTQGGYNE